MSKNIATLKSRSTVIQGHWKWYRSIDWVWFLIIWDIRLQKWRDPENWVRGSSKSLKMSPYDRAHMTSYWRSIVTIDSAEESGNFDLVITDEPVANITFCPGTFQGHILIFLSESAKIALSAFTKCSLVGFSRINRLIRIISYHIISYHTLKCWMTGKFCFWQII